MATPLRLPSWASSLGKWEQELQVELTRLPETLRMFREGVENMQRVTKRLLDATEGLEQFTDLSTAGMSDARRRMEQATETLRERATIADRSDPLRAAAEDMGAAVSAMAELNPFLRPSPSKG